MVSRRKMGRLWEMGWGDGGRWDGEMVGGVCGDSGRTVRRCREECADIYAYLYPAIDERPVEAEAEGGVARASTEIEEIDSPPPLDALADEVTDGIGEHARARHGEQGGELHCL